MSRIYDALKIAEKLGVKQIPLLTPEIFGNVLPRATDQSPAAEDLHSDVQPETRAGRGTLLAARQEKWSPNGRILDFSGSGPQAGTEEFRTLRSRLQQIRTRRPIRKLLITSAMPGEGKSFVATNLAFALASQADQRVLLVDADLRRSSLHTLLGAPARPGLAAFLSGRATAEEILQKGADSRLYFIPAGDPAQNATDLLSTGCMDTLLRQMEPIFDWIIVDSPATLPVSDSVLISAACDGVLFVVRSGSSQAEGSARAAEEFDPESMVGVIVNAVPGRNGRVRQYDRKPPKKAEPKSSSTRILV